MTEPTPFTITLITRDQHSVQFGCLPNEDVISAAERQEILLPQQCRSGACGFCLATSVQGDYQLKDYNPAVLPRDQANLTLLCRTWPRSDLTLQTDYDYAAIHWHSLPKAAHQLLEKEYVSDHVLALTFQQIEGELQISADVQAGQYTYLMNATQTLRRAYSLASIANWDGILQYLIEIHPQGQMSQHLAQANVGDRFWIQGPVGHFVLHDHGLKPRWMIAGGTGIAPLYSMLTAMAELEEPHPTRLFWGLRMAKDVFYAEALRNLQKTLKNLEITICLSKDNHPNYYAGSVIQAFAEALHQVTPLPDIYACGSERLISGIQACLKTHHFTDNTLYFEKFS